MCKKKKMKGQSWEALSYEIPTALGYQDNSVPDEMLPVQVLINVPGKAADDGQILSVMPSLWESSPDYWVPLGSELADRFLSLFIPLMFCL